MSTGGRRPELDGVRGIAIVLVLLGHLDDRVWPLAAAGVALFFTLSGYLITVLLLAETKRTGSVLLRRFYARRLTRLAPPLFVMLLALGALTGATTAELIPPMTWTSNYARLLGEDIGGFGHTWSLSVEEQFYLLWPLCLLFLLRARRPVAVLVSITLTLTAWRIALGVAGFSEYGYMALETAGVPILAGCLLGLTGREAEKRAARTALALLVLTALLVALLGSTPVSYLTPVFTTPAAVILVSAARDARWLAWRPLAFCGIASYSLYLWHVPVSWLVGVGPIGVTVGAASGIVAYLLVELPVMRWRARGVRPMHATEPASALGVGQSVGGTDGLRLPSVGSRPPRES